MPYDSHHRRDISIRNRGIGRMCRNACLLTLRRRDEALVSTALIEVTPKVCANTKHRIMAVLHVLTTNLLLRYDRDGCPVSTKLVRMTLVRMTLVRMSSVLMNLVRLGHSQVTTSTIPRTFLTLTPPPTTRINKAANMRSSTKRRSTPMRIGLSASVPIHAAHAKRSFRRPARSNGKSTRLITTSSPTPTPLTPWPLSAT